MTSAARVTKARATTLPAIVAVAIEGPIVVALALAGVGVGVGAAATVPGCGRAGEPGIATTNGGARGELSLSALLSGAGTEGFARATAPPQMSFPADHGPHPEFRSEWWYLTGILRGRGADGGESRARRFGYQLTIFRQALAARRAPRASAWAARDLYMAHLAVSDIDGDPRSRRFHAAERFARDGLGLAGARASPFDVWLESWRMRGPRSGSAIFPIELRARQVTVANADADADADADARAEPIALDLSIAEGRGPIPQGDRGLSVKGKGAGNASFYYSCTRLPTRGRLTVGGRSFDVEGLSWLDREWSTSALDPDVVGWDWLGAHLDDGRDVMVYRLRTRDAGTTAASRATLIGADGGTRVFVPGAFALTPEGAWESLDHRGRYPAGFHLSIPPAALEIAVEPLLADQELRSAVRYWEGAVAITGTSGGRPATGSGYLEMTGYGARPRAAPEPRSD